MIPGRKVALCSEEPFRVFFPLGLLLGMCGVALWPLFVWHVIGYYPANAHVRLMIEGLMGSFIIGFLGTAGPRLLEVHPFRISETVTLFVLQLFSAMFHLTRNHLAGDVVFLTLLLTLLCVLAVRFRTRPRSVRPPPSFVLVLCGYASAIVGLALILVANALFNGVYLNQLGALMLNQGFVLLPILGVGAFFFSKLLGGTRPTPSDLEMADTEWKRKAGIAAGAGILILASFIIEAGDWTRTASGLRGLATLLFFSTQGRLFNRPAGPPFLARCFRLGFLLLVTGLLLPIFLTPYRVANLHVTFLGGFSVILFTVSTRVVVGHSGQSHLFQQRMPFLIVALTLLLLAMTARVAADFSAVVRNSHLVYAALIWLGAAGAWAWALVPKLLSTEELPPDKARA